MGTGLPTPSPTSFPTDPARKREDWRERFKRLGEEWYSKFGELFRLSEEGTTYEDKTSVGVINADITNIVYLPYASEQKAYVTHQDLIKMDGDDAIVSTALDTLMDAALAVERGGIGESDRPFAIETEDPDVLKILDELCRRIDLYSEIWQIGRNGLKFGSEYRELVIDDTEFSSYQRENGLPPAAIVRFDHRPEHTVWPNLDDKGNKLPGWVQKFRLAAKETAIPFEDWQIVPFLFGEVWAMRGTPLFKSCIRTWKKLQYLEEGLILARLSRAYPKLLHKVLVPIGKGLDPTATRSILDSYRQAIERKRQTNLTKQSTEATFSPLDVTTDLFVPNL
jgi:hypothetical protein